LSGASPQDVVAFHHYGLALGTAYQIYDDCVDIFGSEPQAGKSLGTDADSGKLTLPLLLALREANGAEQGRLRDLLGEDAIEHRQEIARAAAQNGALKGTLDLIGNCTARASRTLTPLTDSLFLESLRRLADFLLERSREMLSVAGRTA
jgi:octaprenyl-diphosphate synthase